MDEMIKAMEKENREEKQEKEKRLSMDKPVSRRDFNRIALTFGATSTLIAFSRLAEGGQKPSAQMLAKSAEAAQKKRSKNKPKYRFRYGVSGHSIETQWISHVGTLDFVRDVEERTQGEIHIEYLGSGSICNEMSCMEKCIQGVIDFTNTSTQNSSIVATYLLILDFGALWPNRASLYNFCYDHRRMDLYQEPMRRLYGVEPIFSTYGLRGFFLSKKKYGKGTPAIDTLEKLRATNATIRTTGTMLGAISMELMGVKPVAISYEEVVDAVRQGAIDGAEAWEVPFSMIHFTDYTGQFVYLKYCSGNWTSYMNVKSFERLPTRLQEAVMESIYTVNVGIQGRDEATIYAKVGSTLDPPPVGSDHWRCDIRNILWSDEELDKLEKLISPMHNPDPWTKWRKKLNRLYGRGDIYEKMYEIAHEVPKGAYAVDVNPKRWWLPNPPWWKDGVWKRGTGGFVLNKTKKFK